MPDPASQLHGVTFARTTTAQQLADLLLERILAGAFRPGDRLRESAIAGEVKVARTTVREAVRALERRGLVRYEVNRGAVVIAPTLESLDEVYTARLRLETAAVAVPVTADKLASVRAAYDELETAATTGDTQRIVEVDLDFHASLVALLGSTRLDDFFAGLTQELRYYLTVLSVTDREHEDPTALLAEHRAILGALETGDADGAVRVVGHHIESNAERLRAILTRRDGDTSP